MSDPNQCILIKLVDENFDALILEVEKDKTPEVVAAEISEAVEASQKYT